MRGSWSAGQALPTTIRRLDVAVKRIPPAPNTPSHALAPRLPASQEDPLTVLGYGAFARVGRRDLRFARVVRVLPGTAPRERAEPERASGATGTNTATPERARWNVCPGRIV